MPEKVRYAARKAAGVCVACGGIEADEGRAHCAGCLGRKADATKDRREALVASGLCEAGCGRKGRLVGGKRRVRCAICTAKYLTAQIERDKRRKRVKK